ncbi:hypothetical protein QCA50_018434 [Cerrena zonata]|uniref:Fatty acid desaturase domain-containing protein n=1 Tax=Cerrena zonata TaxID=2478898 RepID=A0AAW0FEH6_9APHY
MSTATTSRTSTTTGLLPALDSPEYLSRLQTPFVPPPPELTLKSIHAAVPKDAFEKSTIKSLWWVGRHVSIVFGLGWLALRSDWAVDRLLTIISGRSVGADPEKWRGAVDWAFWIAYWFWESVAFTGMWTLGHECGHDALSPIHWVNTVIGVFLHMFMITPYHAWRITHRHHHKGTNHLAHDETYHPFTRTDLKLPPPEKATRMHYKEMIEETPAFTTFKLVVRQFIGFQLYLLHNRKGNPKYPKGTSHYNPSAKLFKPEHRTSILISDFFIISMLSILSVWSYYRGFREVWRVYFVPWLWAHNWIVMFTYLQHSDPTVPYYRGKMQWNFTRGALATVDRPVFGWIGKFFWHGIAHDHVAHHFFVNVPFYNLPKVTEAIKPVLGEYYYYDSTPTLYALWRSFTQCTFIEPEGDVIFFKNQRGEAGRILREEPKKANGTIIEKEIGQGLSDVEEEDEKKAN